MAELIPLPEEGITLSSSSGAASSTDSSFVANSKADSQESPSEDSVHTSDILQESEPEGIPVQNLDRNPHYLAFLPTSDLLAFECGKALLNTFHRLTHSGYVGAERSPTGFGVPEILPTPEGIYPSTDAALKHPDFVVDLVETVQDIMEEFCFVSADYAEPKKTKNDPKSVKRLWNSTACKNKRKELKALQDKAAREAQVARIRNGAKLVTQQE